MNILQTPDIALNLQELIFVGGHNNHDNGPKFGIYFLFKNGSDKSFYWVSEKYRDSIMQEILDAIKAAQTEGDKHEN